MSSEARTFHNVEGLSHQDIAATLGLTAVNVKTRVHPARLFLRKQLEATLSGYRSRVSGRSVATSRRPAPLKRDGARW